MAAEAPLTDTEIEIVERLARESGRIALDMRNGVGVMTKTGPNDLVTDADLTISKKLTAALKEAFPNDLVVSEEDKHPSPNDVTQHPAVSQKRVWLIDPIDGTENYIKNDGQYTTMIGLLVNGAPAFGCIFQPSTETLFWGGTEYGAWKKIGNEPAVKYTPSRRLLDKMPIRLMMGWSDRRKFPWVMSLPHVRFVPSESLGLKILKILEDEGDLFVSLTGRVKLWDTCAPAAIAMGGAIEVGTADGDPLPYPVPLAQHGSSVIIGRPGAISWAMKNLQKKANRSSG